MIAQRIWAFIKDNKVVNIIVCDNYALADSLAKSSLGVESFAVEITQIPTSVGDSYIDGVFKNKEDADLKKQKQEFDEEFSGGRPSVIVLTHTVK